MKVTFDHLYLYDQRGKQVGSGNLTRSAFEEDEKSQTVKLGRGKPIFIEKGKKFILNSRVVEVEDQVPVEEFETGDFFLKDPKKRQQEKEKAKEPPKT